MGLETLIVILVILIIGILADGVRRMLKERNSRLHLRIDPKARELSRQPLDDHNPELPSGGARTVRGGSSRRQSPGMGNLGSVGTESRTPPLVLEPDEAPKKPVTEAVQEELFAATDAPPDESPQQEAASAPIEQKPAPAAAAAPSPAQRPPAEARAPRVETELLEVIVMHMVTPASAPMPGRDLLAALLEQGLRYGDMNIFHRHQSRNGRDELQFSMANALEPGTFDIDAMEAQSFRAVTFFLKMPGPASPGDALERMIKTVRALAERFSGEVRDDQHSALTQQTIEHMRERVRDFERRQRVSGV